MKCLPSGRQFYSILQVSRVLKTISHNEVDPVVTLILQMGRLGQKRMGNLHKITELKGSGAGIRNQSSAPRVFNHYAVSKIWGD